MLSLLRVLFGMLVFLPCMQDSETEKAITCVEKMGGKVTRDETTVGKQVVDVLFKADHCPDELDLSPLLKFPCLRALHLICVPLDDANVQHLTHLQSLRSLTLAATGITDHHLKQLSALHALNKLVITYADITDEGLACVKEFKHLREIEIVGSNITDEGINDLRRDRPNITIRAGNRNTANKRVRKHFAIPDEKAVNKDSIRSTLAVSLPRGSSEQDVYSFLTKCGIGKDQLSSYFPLKEGVISCRIEFDPKSGQLVHEHYLITFLMDQSKTLAGIVVDEWTTGP
jgi:hypothetical protein